jgi:hypothetical protein
VERERSPSRPIQDTRGGTHPGNIAPNSATLASVATRRFLPALQVRVEHLQGVGSGVAWDARDLADGGDDLGGLTGVRVVEVGHNDFIHA